MAARWLASQRPSKAAGGHSKLGTLVSNCLCARGRQGALGGIPKSLSCGSLEIDYVSHGNQKASFRGRVQASSNHKSLSFSILEPRNLIRASQMASFQTPQQVSRPPSQPARSQVDSFLDARRFEVLCLGVRTCGGNTKSIFHGSPES